ncbi:hypothetical protein NQ318_020499 [Aromia moschata]|uniref:Tetraspanin n=1 Tax=Aromia moschata TaxID=1265417 RepID=A0AAV8YEL2_9CUCU|nr:hypothetical protein NQ318_020499 [Aromia moschata]
MGCDDDVVKCLLFWANFLLALVGITVLSLGITYKINLEELTYVIPKDYHNIILLPILTISLGSIIIIVAVFGCYGCIIEKSSFLSTVWLLNNRTDAATSALRANREKFEQNCVWRYFPHPELAEKAIWNNFTGNFLWAINRWDMRFFQLSDKNKFDKELNSTLKEVFGNYSNLYECRAVIDLIQHRLRCCGFNGSTDWKIVPKSCYQTDTMNVHEGSCPSLVSNYLQECFRIIGIALLAFSITELAGSITSILFARYLKRTNRRFQNVVSPFYGAPSAKEYPFLH